MKGRPWKSMRWKSRGAGKVAVSTDGRSAAPSRSVFWLVIPSFLLFVVLPILLNRGHGFYLISCRHNRDPRRLSRDDRLASQVGLRLSIAPATLNVSKRRGHVDTAPGWRAHVSAAMLPGPNR
jgi:hypothetical protein